VQKYSIFLIPLAVPLLPPGQNH